MAEPTQAAPDSSKLTNDLYLLAIHQPYNDGRHPRSINATVVHVKTLLHPALPQPDAGMIYRCLTEFPGRSIAEVVPVSTLTYELDGGRFWPQVGDWQAVVNQIPHLARSGKFDAFPLGLPEITLNLLANGPHSDFVVHYIDGGQEKLGPAEREMELAKITRYVHDEVRRGGHFWPGDDLTTPPKAPSNLPYRPHRRGSL